MVLASSELDDDASFDASRVDPHPGVEPVTEKVTASRTASAVASLGRSGFICPRDVVLPMGWC
ncbi:hypothetical protein [Terrabacter sp. NPDC000476]|uniref:hypothetical protein n=1 Tax=Terrabacter sp. NPDC000476 TaxID=3154258 RepID=UPI003330F0EF